MRHARLQKLQRLRRQWPFYVFLFYAFVLQAFMLWLIIKSEIDAGGIRGVRLVYNIKIHVNWKGRWFALYS